MHTSKKIVVALLALGLVGGAAINSDSLSVVSPVVSQVAVQDAQAYVYTDGMYYEHLAYPVNSTQYRTLLLHRCVPMDSSYKYWACPDAPPSRYL